MMVRPLYCARPPFALERLYAPGVVVSLTPSEAHQGWGARLAYRLPKPAPDDRSELQRDLMD